MHETHVVTQDILQGEARMLGELIHQHRSDLQSVRDGMRFIYFVDAHELKSYLYANDSGKLTGFIFNVERALETQVPVANVESRVRLKAEQMHRRLFFEQPQPLLLLPSHAEEMDEEMAHISLKTLPQDYDLAGIARKEWEILMQKKSVSRQALAKLAESATEGVQVSKKKLLAYLTSEVPTLVQLLFPAPNSLKSRLRRLLSGSRLSLLSGMDWSRMGFTHEQCGELEACVPTDEELERWTRQLIMGRRNSLQSNRRDASALAYLSALNRCFQKMGVNAKACLITRAVTLIKAMRAIKSASGADAQDCIRFSRLVVTQANNGSAVAGPVGDRSLDMVLFALQTYQQRLAIPLKFDAPTTEAVAGELLTAWNAFEDARLTLEFAQESQGDATSTDSLDGEQWRELVAWLQSDTDVSNIVEHRLQVQVSQFKAAMVARDAKSANERPAWVLEAPDGESSRAEAIEVNGLGPVNLPRRFFDDKGTFLLLAEPKGGDVSEEFLALAFLQGCQKRWTLAKFYGRQALQSANIMRKSKVALEARLLVAQLLRVGGPSQVEPDEPEQPDRFVQAAELLLSRTGRRLDDPRVEAEWWALQLERLLDIRASGSHTGAELFTNVQAIRHTLGAVAGVDKARGRLLELLLAHALAGQRKWQTTGQLDRAAFRDLADVIGECHRMLIQYLNERRRECELDEVPQFSRAIEILGYELLRRLAVYAGSPAGEEPEVPAALLFDVVMLQAQMTRSADEMSKMAAAELVRLIDRTRGRRQFQIVYAPVEDKAEVQALIQSLPDTVVREAAARANEVIHDLGNSQRFLEAQASEREQIAEGIRQFDRALSMPGMDDTVRYHLDIGLGYLRLLAAKAADQADQRRAFEQVVRDYQLLIERYPEASVLRYRLSIVLEELGQDEAAFEAINDAMRLVATDVRINPDHWFRSVVRRRLALRFADKATEMRERLKGDDDDAARRHYLEHVAKAYQLVSEAASFARAGGTYVERLEARRRLNNQVYYAALYGSGGGCIESLPNLTRERLLDMTRQLHPDGDMRDVFELNIAHTIGLAYSILGETESAGMAAERVLQLIARSGDNAESETLRLILNDALSWKGAADLDRETAPMPL